MQYKGDVTPISTPWNYIDLSILSSYSICWIHDDVFNGNIFRVTGHLCREFTGHRSHVHVLLKSHWTGILILEKSYITENIDVHDDVITWELFPRYWPFVRGIHRSPVNSPHKGQWHGALMFSSICVWINEWVNNRKAGNLRRYRTHYDVIVMCL